MALATPVITATYAEIALKGRNRSVFMRKLINNIRVALKGEPVQDIQHVESRLLIWLDDPERASGVTAKLRRVFGLQWVSPAVPIDRQDVEPELAEDLAAGREPRLTPVSQAGIRVAEAERGQATNFKVETRRSDRSFALDSPHISTIVGGAIHQQLGLPGRMTHPDFIVNVLVLKEKILVFAAKLTAFGGLPAGSGGRAMVLLSGGIDSPVAAWLMMRRGLRPEFIHFYSGRSVEEADTGKIEELARVLAGFYPVPLVLYLVPVVPFEMRSIGVVPDSYDMVMFRRFMFKTATALARRNSCKALITVDSLGQVASQTIDNLGAIAPDISLPVFRPLIGMDKLEITAWSKTIGAFELSILPYRDCCSIRSPRPVLNARAQDLLSYSREMDLDGAIAEAMAAAVKVTIGQDLTDPD
jgi:thiamine biosynthesis protein ThiI